MLQATYNKMMKLAAHPKALWVLISVAFAESSVFPIPPDPLYIAMILNKREKTWFYATVCTIASVVGGWAGYMIGAGLYDTVGIWIIETYHLESAFQKFQEGFNEWGFWIIALKGLTPIPFKLVTIASGVSGLNLWTFTLASIIARGFRFFLVALLLWHYGPAIKDFIDRNLGLASLLFLGSIAAGFAVFKFVG